MAISSKEQHGENPRSRSVTVIEPATRLVGLDGPPRDEGDARRLPEVAERGPFVGEAAVPGRSAHDHVGTPITINVTGA